MNKGMLIAIVAGALAVGALCSCGSGGDPSPTRQEFLKQAEAVCARAEKQQRAAYTKALQQQETANAGSSQRVVQQLSAEVIIPRAKKMVTELEALGSPEGNEHVVEELFREFRKGVAKAEASMKSFLAGTAFAAADEAAKAYGLEGCNI
jgi:hypothetical protein